MDKNEKKVYDDVNLSPGLRPGRQGRRYISLSPHFLETEKDGKLICKT